MNLDPAAGATDLAALDAARRDFPGYQIDLELTMERPRYVARRTHPERRAAHPHHQRPRLNCARARRRTADRARRPA